MYKNSQGSGIWDTYPYYKPPLLVQSQQGRNIIYDDQWPESSSKHPFSCVKPNAITLQFADDFTTHFSSMVSHWEDGEYGNNIG